MLIALVPFSAAAVENEAAAEAGKVEKLDSVIVSASRAGRKTPVTYSMVYKEQMRGVESPELPAYGPEPAAVSGGGK